MEFHEAIAKLTGSSLFKEWHEKNPQHFLCHGFLMIGDESWQIGWYDAGKIKTFLIDKEIQPMEEQEALAQGEIFKLDPNAVKIGKERALEISGEKFKEHKEPVLKTFFIIQNNGEKTIYNITYFTQTYNTINIHIDAETGEIIKESKQRLMSFG